MIFVEGSETKKEKKIEIDFFEADKSQIFNNEILNKQSKNKRILLRKINRRNRGTFC